MLDFPRTAPRREDMFFEPPAGHVILFNDFMFDCYVLFAGHVPPSAPNI